MKKNQMSAIKKTKKSLLISLIFWLHLPLVVILFGIFFIPLSLWPGRIEFHFWFISTLLFLQLLWGVVLYPKTGKIDFICPLTTVMQSLRGFPIESKENYNHSFIAELLGKLRINISFFWVDVLLLIIFIIVSFQYFW